MCMYTIFETSVCFCMHMQINLLAIMLAFFCIQLLSSDEMKEHQPQRFSGWISVCYLLDQLVNILHK